jgi:GH15 family glucan-1,4-alpha-glucosidase
VRVGNAAAGHLQLDVCADIVSAVHVRPRQHGAAEVEQWDALVAMADWLSDAWAQPDRGVWGLRGEPRQLVSSKLAAWCALDRMVTLARAQNPLDLSAPGWLLAARQVEAWLEQHGLAIDGGLRQDDTVADAADAALLQVAWRGPWPSDHRVVTKTIDRVLKRLGDGPHVHRYGTDGPGDGLPGREGAFVACSFWAVRALARVGRWEEAHDRMEQLVALSGPLGLLPEEVDPLSGAWLGNLPHALSHLALVQAALELASGPR